MRSAAGLFSELRALAFGVGMILRRCRSKAPPSQSPLYFANATAAFTRTGGLSSWWLVEVSALWRAAKRSIISFSQANVRLEPPKTKLPSSCLFVTRWPVSTLILIEEISVMPLGMTQTIPSIKLSMKVGPRLMTDASATRE